MTNVSLSTGSARKNDGNLQFKNFNEDEFYRDLASCRAVITNGGFSLMTEALYLQKPILSVPVKNSSSRYSTQSTWKGLDTESFVKKSKKRTLKNFYRTLKVIMKK